MRFDSTANLFLPRYKIALPVSLLLAAVLSLAYWEFIYDINPKEALAYYGQIEPVLDEDNGVYTYAGIAAPLSVEDYRDWGKTEVSKNTLRYLNGEDTIGILDHGPRVDDRLFINWNVGEVYGCWIPGAGKDGYPDCIDEAAMRKVIETNRTLLERYKNVFDYSHYDSEVYYQEGLASSLTLTKLLVIDYWFKRDNLTDEDISTIFKFFRFWENVSRKESLGLVIKAISLVNSGLAGALLGRLSERNPDLLEQYANVYGKFFYERVGAREIDNINRGEFRLFNTELCFITHYGNRTVLCEPAQKRLLYKPGRTVRLLFNNRLKEPGCTNNGKLQNSSEIGIYLRPGNYIGRAFENIFAGSLEKSCEIFKNINVKAERNELRNLYLYFRQNDYDAEKINFAYQNEKERFRIGGTERFFSWNNGKKELVWEFEDSNLVRYAIPYR